ncbi:WD40 repeat domain-containing protein [Aliinostoc sp. HNIBRCY26]|uniref:WD40 repeat domain-containing protein n=1 Tax=Aliinostoc sp. HNIBRCY26 TaxID=3418997 RepID=UPI003D051E7B
MNELLPNQPSQEQENLLKDTSVGGDLTYAPVQIINYYYREEARLVPSDSTDAADESLPCPYRGLFHFGPDDAEFFFGREVFVEELFAATQSRNFIPVLGASGSGKSSVVLAGLVPKLQKEGYWKFTHFRPGSEPFQALAESLVPLYEPDKNATEQMFQARKLAEYFANGSIPLQDVFSKIKRNYPNHRVLLIADQFEELYTLCADQKIRHSFLDTLLACFQSDPDNNTVLVGTMRADFLGNLLSYRPLADVLQNADIKLPPMNCDELSQVIAKPAEKLGVTFQDGLVERILDDVEDEPGNLPLLEFALTQLWKQRTGKQLTHTAYEEIGEVKGALARHADENYGKLSPTQKEHVRRIFIQLVHPGEGTEDTRRLATKAELGEASWGLVKQLADNRLVVTSQNSANQETVEVVHEALIRNWGELRQWMDADRSFRAWQDRLRSAMYQWEQTQRDEGALLRGAALVEGEEKLKQRREDISTGEQEFIQASVEVRDRQKKQEKEARKRQIVVTSITSVFFAGFAILAGYQWRQAEIGQIQALSQSSKTNFTVNRNSFDALIDVLKAGKHLQQFPGGITDQEVEADVLTNLAQSVNWVREQNRLQGHTSGVQSVSFSPDGQMLATASSDRTVRLWRRDGSLFKILKGHTQEVRSVRFSPDRKTIASGGLDGTVRLWDNNGNFIRLIPAHKDPVMSVSFSPNGKTIATASVDKTVKLWRLDGQLLFTFEKHQGLVRQVSFSPKGDRIITVSDDKTVKLWSQDGKLLKTLDKYSDAVASADFSPDGSFFVTGSTDGTVNLWNQEGEFVRTFKHSGAVWSVSVSIDAQTIASASTDGTVRLWARDGRLLDTWAGHEGVITNVAFSPDGNVLATAGRDGITKLWQVNRSGLTLLVGQDDMLGAKFSQDRKRIASASSDGTVSIWSQDGKLLSTPIKHQSAVNAVSFSRDGKTIVSGDDDGTIRLWRDGQPSKILGKHKGSVLSLSFSPDEQILASASADRTAKLWNLDGKELITLEKGNYRVLSVAFSSDGHTIATAGDDKTVKLWSHEGKELRRWETHTSVIRSVGFSADGQTIITAGDKIIELWQRDGRLITTLSGHQGSVLDISFSPNGKIIASASSDKTIKLWQRDGTLITTLSGHQGSVHTVSFSSDSKWLASAGADKLVLLWDVSALSLKGLLEKGCNQISNYLNTQTNTLKTLCN